MENNRKENFKISINYLILCIISLLYVMCLIQNYRKFIILIMVILITLSEILFYFVLKSLIKKNIAIEKVYLFFAVVFGVIYIFIFPFSQVPDDKSDYLRSLEVSNFHLTSVKKDDKVGRFFSSNIEKVFSSKNYSDLVKTMNIKLNHKKVFYKFANKSLYAFVCYIPQALGVGIGLAFKLSIVAQANLGKIINYIFFVIITFYSIRFIPQKKLLVFFIALLPITMQEATSLSPDAMAIGVSIALVSFITYFRYKDSAKMNKKNSILLFLLVFLLSMCKIVYLPLCFLIFLIPNEKFKTKKQKYIYCIMTSLIIIIFNLLWLKISSSYLIAFSSRSNSSEQLKFILHNPFQYVIVMFKTINYFFIDYLKQIIGSPLGNLTIDLSPIMIIIGLGMLYKLIVNVKEKRIIIRKSDYQYKIFIVVIILMNLLLIFTSLYMQWNSVGAEMIMGIQGRYFIPLILVVSMIFMNNQAELNSKNIISYSIINNIMALITIGVTFI